MTLEYRWRLISNKGKGIMNAEQLSLFTDDELPRLTDTEEALHHYMRKCLQLENELNEYKIKFGELDEIAH